MSRWSQVRALRRARSSDRAVRVSVLVFGLLVAWAAQDGLFSLGELLSPTRRANLARFGTSLVPPAWREAEFAPTAILAWLTERLTEKGLEAAGTTAWMAVLAISLAALVAALLAPFATRTLLSREPYLDVQPEAPSRLSFRLALRATRALLIALRALPEYVLAFLLLALLGRSAWPAVLALAIHNAGILGRLQAETLENLPTPALRALRLAGASRAQLALVAQPQALGRYLAFVFYRFETCVREATVLGLLGIVSLGYWIEQDRTRRFYDEMLLWIALGAVLVLLAELTSHVVRRWLREA